MHDCPVWYVGRNSFPSFNDFFIATLKAPRILLCPEGSWGEILPRRWEKVTEESAEILICIFKSGLKAGDIVYDIVPSMELVTNLI